MEYYEVLTNNLSICIDSDVAYYHNFNKGDIITLFISDCFDINNQKTNEKFLSKIKFDNYTLDYDDRLNFVIKDKTNWSSARLMTLLQYNIIEDVTKKVERDNKINNILNC